MKAWKKQSPNSIFLNVLGVSLDSNHDLLTMGSIPYEPIKLALSPAGGSLVILTPFCKTETGKIGDGYEVNQILNSLCGFYKCNSSHNFSSVPINEIAR